MIDLSAMTEDERRRFAYKVGQDAGNRSMRRAGRTKWNEEDWDSACEAFKAISPDDPTQHAGTA